MDSGAKASAALGKPITAGLVLIGNELLSGKIEDLNGRFLALELFDMGWLLEEVTIIPDREEIIVETLQRLSGRLDHLFTSGGIGPTHDDVTIAALAKAKGKALVNSPILELMLKKLYHIELLTPAQRRLSLIPEGAVLHYGQSSQYPQIVVDNIYPLPGIPELFRQKFLELKDLWPSLQPRQRRCLNLIAEETEVAELLAETALAYPQVQLGSYPNLKNKVWHLELVLESSDVSDLEKATQKLTQALGIPPQT